MAVNLNRQLAAFSRAIDHHGDNMRVTLRDDRLLTDTNDVGVLSRLFRPRAGAQQIAENNAVRTALLNALSDQFGGREKIPASVLKALNGSSLRGRSDMSTTDGQVVSGRPLTARRIRAVLMQVRAELSDREFRQNQPPGVKPLEPTRGDAEEMVEMVEIGESQDIRRKSGESRVAATPLKGERDGLSASPEDARSLREFRTRMQKEGDDRVMRGVDSGKSGKDPVAKYAESFAREMMAELADEDYGEAQEFWRSVGRPDPSGKAGVDDITRQFARGLGGNREVFEKLSRAIGSHIRSGGTPQGLKEVRTRVISDALKAFRAQYGKAGVPNALRKGGEPLPLNDETISRFKTGMPKEAIDDVESRVKANAFPIAQDAKWFNAYTQWTIESMQKNTAFAHLALGSVGKATSGMFLQALRESHYVFDRVHDAIDDSIRHGKAHSEVQRDVQKSITDFLLEFGARRNAVMGTESKGEIAPKRQRAPTGLRSARDLPSGVVLSQGQNTCPIIGLMNAMLMTCGETAEKARAFMTRHREGNRSYFEFPDPDRAGRKIRAYTDEFDALFENNAAVLSDFEKAVFVALRKAGLRITNDAIETQPGRFFEISPVFVLFGFREPESVGNVRGDRPSQMQQCLDGQKIAEAIKAGKPCVLGAPGHFVGIESVEFDKGGLPTYTYFDSSSKRRGTLKPIDNTGYQFYIGEKA